MSNIDTINVGGLDYSVEDSEARDIATGAVNVSAYVENGNTASRAYPTIGTPINWKGSLYYTKATITAGSTLSTATNLTAAANLGAMIRNIKTYVGSDSKLHFTDATGADSVLPFSGSEASTITISLKGTTRGVSFKLSTYGVISLAMIAVVEVPNGYSNGYYCKDIYQNKVIVNVAAGGGGTKNLTVSGDNVNVAFTNTEGQSRTFNITMAGQIES